MGPTLGFGLDGILEKDLALGLVGFGPIVGFGLRGGDFILVSTCLGGLECFCSIGLLSATF